jgi:hypothetical protein
MATALLAGPARRLVFSYAREDEALRDRLEIHLRPLERAGLLACWHDRDIRAGGTWREDIRRAIERADVVLLLISPDFVASEYCYTVEMAGALRRHTAGSALVIPVVLRPVAAAAGQPWAELQGVPRDLRPVTLWPDLDEALATVAREVLEALENWSPARPAGPASLPAAAEPVVEERVLDAAVPARVRVGEASEVVALVRRPESGGLRAVLEADEAFAARPQEVRSQEFDLQFPRDERGRPLPLRLTLALESPDFEPPRQTKRIQVPPSGDSPLYVFLAAPRRAGLLALQIEVLAGDVSIVSHLLRSQAAEAAVPERPRYVMATLPLVTVGFGRRTTAAAEMDVTVAGKVPAPTVATRPSTPVRRSPSTGAFPRTRPPAASPGPRPTAARPVLPAFAAIAAAVVVGFGTFTLWRAASGPASSPSPRLDPPVAATPPPGPRTLPPGELATALSQVKVRFDNRDFAGVVALVDGVANPSAEMEALAGHALYATGRYALAAARFESAARAQPANRDHPLWAQRAWEAARARPAATSRVSPSLP